ncbi:MAG: response regulator transcription factor [Deltaproteobacteria bacterium]|jgi:DNA-binding NarL/FixJ family response regulator|nr:response regulator transcription factor [Deltaproteobacteria bacterium]
MAILLSSANDSVIKRWESLLKDKYDLQKANTLTRLKELCTDEKFDLIFLHRPLVDPAAFKEIRQLNPAARIFLLSDKPDEEEGLIFLKLGIVGYANTYISAERLTEATRVVAGGAVWLGQKVMQRLILDSYHRAKEDAAATSEKKLESLTGREREIANLVAQGQSNLEIAANLDITERTVKAHLSSIYEKTGTGSRLNLALLINRG